jgi:nucleoside-diphosphate-sugar epimerase
LTRILVSGGRGFLGRRLLPLLAAGGAEVLAPGREALDVALDRFPPDRFDLAIHLAARTFVPDSWADPAGFLRVNAQGTVNMLEHCRRSGAAMIHVSGYCYGHPDILPTPESAPLRPNNPYGFSKAAAEDACRFYAERLGLPVTVLRPFNIYGPGQEGRFLVPAIVGQVLRPGSAAITIEDAAPRRDYVHVDDVAAAIAAAASAVRGWGVYNVASGSSHSVGELVAAIQAAAGTDKPVVERGRRRPDELMDTRGDIRAIGRDLGWAPRITLAAGLAGLVAG